MTPPSSPPEHGGHDDGQAGVDAASISARRERRLLVVLVLNVAIVLGEAIAGIVAHSLGLLADAGHNLTDVAGVVLALIAVRWARRPPTDRRSFGYHRGTVLAAQAAEPWLAAHPGARVFTVKEMFERSWYACYRDAVQPLIHATSRG